MLYSAMSIICCKLAIFLQDAQNNETFLHCQYDPSGWAYNRSSW